MKAIIYHQYGSPDVLQLQDMDKPVVRDDAVLVKIRAAAANPYDWNFIFCCLQFPSRSTP